MHSSQLSVSDEKKNRIKIWKVETEQRNRREKDDGNRCLQEKTGMQRDVELKNVAQTNELREQYIF